jgi:hypothetical protein
VKGFYGRQPNDEISQQFKELEGTLSVWITELEGYKVLAAWRYPKLVEETYPRFKFNAIAAAVMGALTVEESYLPPPAGKKNDAAKDAAK